MLTPPAPTPMPAASERREGFWLSTAPDGRRRLVVVRHTRPLPFNQLQARPPGPHERGTSASVWLVKNEIKSWRRWPADYLPVAPLTRRLRLQPPVHVTVNHFRQRRGRPPDVGAPMVAVKALLDGLVDVKILPEDGPGYVSRLTYEAPTDAMFNGLRLTIDEQPGQEVLPIPAEGEQA